MANLMGLLEKCHGEIAPLHIAILAFSGLWFPPYGPSHGVPLRNWLPYATATASSIFFVFMEMLGEAGALLKLENISTEGIGENSSYLLARIEVLVKLFQSVLFCKEWQALATDIDHILRKHCLPAERRKIIHKTRRLSEVYLLMFLGTMCFAGVNVIFQKPITTLMGGTPDMSYKLPVRFWILTPGYESPVYEFFLTIQVMSQIYTPFCLTAVDSYAYVLAAYTAQTLKTLQKQIKSLPGRPEDEPTTDWSTPDARANFTKCVRFHHDLIR